MVVPVKQAHITAVRSHEAFRTSRAFLHLNHRWPCCREGENLAGYHRDWFVWVHLLAILGTGTCCCIAQGYDRRDRCRWSNNRINWVGRDSCPYGWWNADVRDRIFRYVSLHDVRLFVAMSDHEGNLNVCAGIHTYVDNLASVRFFIYSVGVFCDELS